MSVAWKKPASPDESSSEEWAGFPWRKLERHLYRLQKRIFKASERGDLKTVHKLQKVFMRVSVGPTLSRPTSDPGQPRQENRWDRWSKVHSTHRSTRHGGSPSPKTDEEEEAKASQTRLDTQARKN